MTACIIQSITDISPAIKQPQKPYINNKQAELGNAPPARL